MYLITKRDINIQLGMFRNEGSEVHVPPSSAHTSQNCTRVTRLQHGVL